MKSISLIVLMFLMLVPRALAQSTQPTIALATDIEDGKKMIQATVTLNGKPVTNVTLVYLVQRTFGNLNIGQDTTLDDGTSAVKFPSDLPSAADGKLHLIVQIKSPAQFASVSSTAAFAGDMQPAAADDPYPRALWAPHAPLALMASIFVVLAAVWLSYLFVVSRILAIRTGGHP